jgi:proteasome-associated ATPase
LFAQYGKRMVKGVLLVGPPGTGKTLLGKAAATSVAKAHGKTDGGGFIYIKGPELLNAYIGRSEEAVRGLFIAARDYKERYGIPVVIFMDEADSLLGARDRGVNVSVNATVVPQFLAEMDGLDDHAAIFILATNKPELLDPAVVREGRVDRKVRVDRPRREDAAAIFEIHLRGRPLIGEGHIETGVEELYSDKYPIHPRFDGTAGHVMLRDFVSGAMINNIIEQASTAAVMRDIAGKRMHAGGITVKDILGSIERTARGQRDISPGA